MKTVMVATGARIDSRLLHAVSLWRAIEHDAELRVVHVLNGREYEEASPAFQRAIKDETRLLIRTMVGLAAKDTEAGDIPVTMEMREGDVAEELIASARENAPLLVVIGAHSATGEMRSESYDRFLVYLEKESIPVESVEVGL